MDSVRVPVPLAIIQRQDMCGPQKPLRHWRSHARFVILSFQTNRQNEKDRNASLFNPAKLRDVKLDLKSQYNSFALVVAV